MKRKEKALSVSDVIASATPDQLRDAIMKVGVSVGVVTAAAHQITEAQGDVLKGSWIVEPSSLGKFMIIELDETDDGRLVADKLRRDDAERIVRAVNGRDSLINALSNIDGRELATLIGMCKEGSDVHDLLLSIQGQARSALDAAGQS